MSMSANGDKPTIAERRKTQAVLRYLTLFVAGCQVTLGVLAWRSRDADQGFLETAASPFLAALLLFAGIVAVRLSRTLVSRVMIAALCIGALYFVGPGTPYFDALGIGNTPTAIEFATIVVVWLYLITPFLMMTYAFAIARDLSVRTQAACTRSSFVHRSLLDPHSEWKPEQTSESEEPARMPARLGFKLLLAILIGTGVAAAASYSLELKASEPSFGWWGPPDSPISDLHFTLVHPAVMFIAMFVIIAALWRVAAQRRMGRVLLGLALGMQALIGVGLFV